MFIAICFFHKTRVLRGSQPIYFLQVCDIKTLIYNLYIEWTWEDTILIQDLQYIHQYVTIYPFSSFKTLGAKI